MSVWKEVLSKSHNRVYWYNEATKVSSWTKPPELAGDEQQQLLCTPLLTTPSAAIPQLHPYKNNYRNEQYQHEQHQIEAHCRRQDARAEKVHYYCCYFIILLLLLHFIIIIQTPHS